MQNTVTVNNGVKGTGTSCEGPSPGRCPIAQQGRPGRHHTTAGRRKDWTKEDEKLVMACYYKSEPEKRGYRKRMHQLWMENARFFVTEQRLLDQKRLILERKWLTEEELE